MVKDMINEHQVTCDAALLLLSRSLEGDLSRTETCRLYIHLASCCDCRQVMADLAKLELGMENLQQQHAGINLDADFAESFQVRLGNLQTVDTVVQLRQFSRRITDDQEMRSKLQAATDQSRFIALFVEMGEQCGYIFSPEQVSNLLNVEAANDSELSDAQLDHVAAAGGAFNSRQLIDFLASLDK
jgi:hypothetical protein